MCTQFGGRRLSWSMILFLSLCGSVISQDSNVQNSYESAMKAYDAKNYSQASIHFTDLLNHLGAEASESLLYNGACIYALNNENERAIEILKQLAESHFYSNLEHIATDPDLERIREAPEWESILKRIEKNKETRPQRLRESIKTKLFNAKKLLQTDGGKFWGVPIWSEDLLVLDYDNTIFSLKKLPNSKTEDSVIYYKTIPENTLSFTNSAQEYEGNRVAVVLADNMDDESATIIHELFHLIQLKARSFRGNPVDYLDEHMARQWLRLEFVALRNALAAADESAKEEAERYLADALTFRKLRQSDHQSSLQAELEIETLEGMANFTGFALSSHENKFKKAIKEIRFREMSATFTRPFPYATGPAYGLLFDYLEFDWKSDMTTVYNFLEIFERQKGHELATDKDTLDQAKARNNFPTIYEQEQRRKIEHEKNVKFYTRLLVNQPTLRASLNDGNSSFSVSFNMNGTLALDGHGTVYSSVKGVDVSGENFGSFETIAGKDQLGVSGILSRTRKEFIFPIPIKIEGKKIIGETYTIQLNEGWEVKKINQKGDLEVVKSKDDQ